MKNKPTKIAKSCSRGNPSLRGAQRRSNLRVHVAGDCFALRARNDDERPSQQSQLTNIAVFASGNGTNLQAIIDAIKNGAIKARIMLVVSDNEKAYALERARRAGIETLVLNKEDFACREEFDRAAVRELKRRKVELVALAGYMRLLSPYFVGEYRNRILNIHPALLPSFKGTDGIGDALKAGAKVTGVTVHFVTEELDAGPVILQETVGVKDNDTRDSLAERIHIVEHGLYPKAIRYFIEGRLKIEGDKVVILNRSKILDSSLRLYHNDKNTSLRARRAKQSPDTCCRRLPRRPASRDSSQ